MACARSSAAVDKARILIADDDDLLASTLSWLLKEVPLRTTVGPSAEAAVEAPAGGTPDERGLVTTARPSLEAD